MKHAIQFRRGHTVQQINLRLEDLPRGTFNVHVPIIFDDGEKWIARIRQRDLNSLPLSIERHIIQAEIDAIRWLGTNDGVPVPKVMSPILSESSPNFS